VLLLLACALLVRKIVLIPLCIVGGCAGFGYLHWWYPTQPAWPLILNYDGRAIALGLLAVSLLVTWYRTRELRVPLLFVETAAPTPDGQRLHQPPTAS
jgi:hypothetical protein